MFENYITIWSSARCFVSEGFGTMNGPGRSGYECMRSQKESTKQNIARISHIDWWNFWKRALYKLLAAFLSKSWEPDFLT